MEGRYCIETELRDGTNRHLIFLGDYDEFVTYLRGKGEGGLPAVSKILSKEIIYLLSDKGGMPHESLQELLERERISLEEINHRLLS